jgi:ABC-type transport system involved in cytochrome c biogenesis permease subunit
MGWFRRHYGAGPLHLLSLVACVAFAGYVATRILAGPEAIRILVWFAGAAVAHDLILWPLYAVADKGAVVAARRHPERLPKVPWINHLRVPAVLSAVLLAVSFPLVFRWSEPTYHAASGLTEAPYLGRWLLVTGVAFGLSAVLYALRVGRVMAREKR